uniref:Odorant receptor 42 n=1 Tax=Eucryptorrhynchus scrobiculatus TaxID=1552824 RepID=A0A8F4MYV4_EUCSC|nr:odorant receptor 42 [Eucryptorrhynchus scrobiculatus]
MFCEEDSCVQYAKNIRIRKVFISSSIKEQTVIFKVKELIRQHQNIIKFATKLNDGIKNIIFIEYILASVNVAAALLHILTLEFSGEMIFSIFHFLLLLVQIFILAFTAQEINTQSFNISNAVYESSWIDQSEAIKRMKLIMLMRAQKPLAISIGPFRPMNIEAALMTLKGAYSYTSLMIQKYI